MSLLLNIDTATETASVCVTLNGVSLSLRKNKHQKEHASFVHTSIAEILESTGYKLKDIDGFAVTSGPGSYTGLRVGMAAAKGFCFALTKPLISINTLEVMVKAATDAVGTQQDTLFCPMIDARRMEVFAAIYNSDLETVLPPTPVILTEEIFDQYLMNNKILFFGSGSAKFSEIQSNNNSIFEDIQHDARALGQLADKAYRQRKFADLTYSEPTYFKNFQSIAKNSLNVF